MSSRCQEAVESSPYPVKKGTQCVHLSARSKPQQSKTRTTGMEGFSRRPLRRRRFCLAQAIRRQAPPEVLCQDLHPIRSTTLSCIGRRARRPPRAGLGGSFLESHRLCQGREGGARAPLGGVLPGTFPSERYKARKTKPTGVHRKEHPRGTRVESRARQPPLARRSPTSRRGSWAARLHRRAKAQLSRVSGAPLAFTHGALRGSTSQLRSHAFRLAEHGRRSSAPAEEHSGGP